MYNCDMLTRASFPKDLRTWHEREDDPPFYLELYGEDAPTLDTTFAQVIPVGGTSAETIHPTPVYEYFWTLGHAGSRSVRRRFRRRNSDQLWSKLADTAARVYIYFPVSAGWRANEIVASVKYLGPVKDQETWSQKAGEDWQRVQPMIAGASHAAETPGVVPGVGAVAAATAPVLGAIAKLQVGNVPLAVRGFGWYVEKVTIGSPEHGLMQGIVWALPREMFEALGGRLTGSVAVSLVATQDAPTQDALERVPYAPGEAAVLAHACVYADNGEFWAPRAKNEFVELPIRPTMPVA